MIEEGRAISELRTGVLHKAGDAHGFTLCGSVLRAPMVTGPAALVAEKARAVCEYCYPPREGAA